MMVLQWYYNCQGWIDNGIIMLLQLLLKCITKSLKIIRIVIIKACGIIHLTSRVHALYNVITMLATSARCADDLGPQVQEVYLPSLSCQYECIVCGLPCTSSKTDVALGRIVRGPASGKRHVL